MKKLATILMYCLVILVVVVVLSPKRYLYNFVQHVIVQENIILSHELTKDQLISLEVSHADIYVKDILIGALNKMTVYPFMIFNQVTCEGFASSKEIEGLFSTSIDKVSLFHWIGQPYQIAIKAQGDFGLADGFIHVRDRKIYLKIVPSEKFIAQINKLDNSIKKSEGGFYTYEYSY